MSCDAGINNIRHAVTGLIADAGVEFNVLSDRSVEVERRAVFISPAEEGIAFSERDVASGHRVLADRAAQRNILESLECGFLVDIIDRHRKGGSFPLGINGDVLRGHGLAGEDILLFTCRISIPTDKNIAFLAFGHSSGLIVSSIRDESLKFVGLFLCFNTVAHIYDVIAVAGVVEFCTVVQIIVVSTMRVSETGNVVLVFLTNIGPATRTGVAVVELVIAARKRFYIVVSSFTTITGFRPIECSATQGHCINIDLIGVAIF